MMQEKAAALAADELGVIPDGKTSPNRTRGRRRSSVARPIISPVGGLDAAVKGRARADTIRSAQLHVERAEAKAKDKEDAAD